MRVLLRSLWLVAVLAAVFVFPAFAQTPEPPAPTVPDLVALFFSLSGVGLLVTAIVNALKLTPLIKDGQAGWWVTGLNLAGLGLLYFLKIFAPTFDLANADSVAGQLAQILTLIVGLGSQIGFSQVWHGVLKRLALPLVSTSFKATPSEIKDKLAKG